MADTARIDKWLWASRIFKTRSLAANACKNGRVTINGVNVKPSHMVKTGETVSVKKPPVTYSFKILQCIEQRVGAKLIPGIYENVTWRMARSYFISKMVDEGYHALQIAEQTGNSPNAIHRYYYSRTNKEELRQNMNKVF